MTKKTKDLETSGNKIILSNEKLFTDVSHLIEQSRRQVVMQANSTLTLLFWQVGKRINEDILQNQRAEYGKQILPILSAKLENLYGRNFTERNVRRMMQFAEQFKELEIVSPLATQLSWSHFTELLPLKSYEAKLFYAQLSIDGKFGKRELRKQIANKAFERTEIANLQSSQSEDLPINTFKDPYLLDFLGLQNDYLEKDIETAILHELEKFILELGKGFAFGNARRE